MAGHTQGGVTLQRRFHYEQAFEHYLRAKAIPYVAVDEARRALTGKAGGPLKADAVGPKGSASSLKNFDFVVYSENGPNLLIDVKGRKLPASKVGKSGKTATSAFQNWVTADDVDHMAKWQGLFGDGFIAAFAFLFWCDAPPPDALFQEVFEYDGKWYAILAITLENYRQHMRPRSVKWETVNIPSKMFRDLSQPLEKMLKNETTLGPSQTGLFPE